MNGRLKEALKGIRWLRSIKYFFLAIRDSWRWQSKPVLDQWLNDVYANEDPWSYTTCPEEYGRFASALRLLDAEVNGRKVERAFEVGCAEGVFTQMLAERCHQLTAVDIAPAALARARSRLKDTAVDFQQWDVLHSPTPDGMNLVVIMDVLELFYRPAFIRKARERLVASLSPEGYLLLGNSRQNDIYESSWWGKWMLRGGKRIAECFAEHPQLELVATETRGIYMNALFRKKPARA